MTHHLYRHFDASGRLLYVGISLHAPNRLTSHNRSRWFRNIAIITFEKFKTRQQLLFAEMCAILREKPLFNLKGRPDMVLINKLAIPCLPHTQRNGAKIKLFRKYLGRPTPIHQTVRVYCSKVGTKGGRSRSPAKVAAARRNAAKATKARKTQQKQNL